ncbi:MAG: LPS export ABC transporter periplasmic protein LptC [Pseudomonadales bacterium]
MTLSSLATSKRAHAALALLIVLVAVLALERSGDGKLTIIDVTQEEVADNYSTDVTALQFNKSGGLQYHLHTDDAAHYLSSDESILQRPILLSYGEDGTIWRSVSDHGKVRPGGNIVDLWGNVTIRRADDGVQIASDNMTFNTLDGDADTTAAVTIKTPSSNIEGIGMHANINTEIVNLLKDVRGIYGSRTTP